MTHVVVLAGNGFIGSHVVKQLLERNCSVTVYSRRKPDCLVTRGSRWLAAPADEALTCFDPALFSPSPDAVIHMMAMGEVEGVAAADAFEGRCGQLLLVSSADVYLAYGRLIRSEPGPPVPMPLDEAAPLRTRLFPYRKVETNPAALEFRYEKILAERAVLERPSLGAVVARLPKVYGPGGNDDLATIYEFAAYPNWRWTHGYVENVAASLVFLALHGELADQVYNVGEEHTPTVAERLARLPPSIKPAQPHPELDLAQDLVVDSSRLRALGYRDPIPCAEGLRRTLGANRGN